MFANHKGEIPFVILLLPFLVGIGLALYLTDYTSTNVPFILLVCLGAVFFVLNISYRQFSIYKFNWLGGVLIQAILFCAGWVCAIDHNELNKADHFSKHKSQYLAIKVATEPVVKNGSVRFAATVNGGIEFGKHSTVLGQLLVNIKDSAAFYLNYGDVLLIPARYNTVDPPFNPAEFNYKQYLAHQNIYHQVFLYTRQYAVIERNTGNPIIAYSLQLRKKLVAKFNTRMHDSSAIAVASTMILGYKADLSDDVLQAYANTGTLHVLSVSGAHVAIVFVLLSWALSFLNKFEHGKFMKTFLIITSIWVYALLTGFSPAVNRAALMISLIIVGNNFYRYINPLNLLAVSAFALLLYNPYYITDVGFQLSYLAVGGLIVFQPVLYKTHQFEHKWLDKLWSLCTVSIAAQIITFPLSVYYFHQFPLYFLLSNLFILLPVLAIMYIGLAFLLFSWIPVISDALVYLLEKSVIVMNEGLSFIKHLPYANINKLWISKIDYLLIYCAIILLFYFLYNHNKRLLNLSLVLLFVVMISVAWKKIDSQTDSSITFLNLKKQRAIVFINGTQAVVLSDLNSTDKNYHYSIQPGLDSAKVESVNVYGFAENIDLPQLKKSGNLIRFQNKITALLDSSSQNLKPLHPLKADYVFITHTPPISIAKVNQIFNSQLLVVSSDNSDRYIDSLKKQLLKSSNKYYLLKHNRALNLSSD
ncbi:ComEC/Rec2 family competence protein [Mucilaginibacter sp. HD30]